MSYSIIAEITWQERCDVESVAAQEDWENANRPESDAPGDFEPEF
jgi:hypothetical protein